MGDFRPISLPRGMAKLFAKVLTSRARPQRRDIVTFNQPAFVKGRNLQDNFLLVRQVARKIKGVFLKLDITRAFDSLSWPFLFEDMKAKWFGERWMSWMSILLCTASTRVLVNGIPARRIFHARGLRQVDPISPLLFVIAMDALTAIFVRAVEEHVITPFRGILACQGLSIYADDVVIFIHQNRQDLWFIKEVLDVFGEAFGLRVSYRKTSGSLIHGNQADKDKVASILHCDLSMFPYKYLGLQLAINQLTRAA